MSAHLDSSYGAAFIGVVVAAVLYGISCVQAFYYYLNQNDPWYLKLLVTTVMICDTVHQALISHVVYTYTITHWGDPAQLEHMVWSLVVESIFVAIPALIVQGVLSMRIWRLSRNIYLIGIPMILSIASFVILIISAATALPMTFLAELDKTKGYTIDVMALSSVSDIIIAATLCTLLHSSRTGYYKSEVIINRLIVFTVNTGLITSLCAVACLVSLLVAGNTLIYIAFFFCLGRLYTNTLLATFNARESIRKVDQEWSTAMTSLPSRDFRNKISNQTESLPMIKIDAVTSAETSYSANNQKLEEKLAGFPDDEGSAKVPS